MNPRASGPRLARSRVRRGLPPLLLLPLLLVLAGCFRLDMDLTINEDDTVDVSMEMSDLTGVATREEMDCATLGSQLGDAPAGVDFSAEDIEDSDGNVGCRLSATGAPLDTLASGGGMSIERVDDTYVYSFDGDETVESQFEGAAGMEPEVRISVTFPGEVIEADGEVDGNTVTWTGLEAFATGGSATGSAESPGVGGDSATIVWIILGVVALLVIAALIFFFVKRRQGGSGSAGADGSAGAAGAAPYGGAAAAPYGGSAAPYGQPGQPVGGFGPPDQVPADPGVGYPGQEAPTAPTPFSTAAADAPVNRPEGSSVDRPEGPPVAPPAAGAPGSEAPSSDAPGAASPDAPGSEAPGARPEDDSR